MGSTLTPNDYYIAFSHFVIACQAQAEARRHETLMQKIIKNNESISDAIYSPDILGTKEEFDNLILGQGIQVDWLTPEKKKKEVADERQ